MTHKRRERKRLPKKRRSKLALRQSLLRVRRQVIGEMNPGQSIFNPGVIVRRDGGGLVKAANGDIDLVGVRFGEERQRGTALRTERTQSPSPFHLSRLSGGEAKVAPRENAPVTKGAPLLRRQSKQWQWVML